MPSKSMLAVVLLLAAAASRQACAGPDGSDREANYDRCEDPHGFNVFLREGGWCWFQDPRAIIHQGKLILGGVQGNGSGDAVVGVYDLKKMRPLGRVVLRGGFKGDDHNCPVFFARPDDRLLAVYALHHNNRVHYYRISDPDDYLKWGAERQFEHVYPNAGNVTYMNLYELEGEGKIYNFFRGIEFNPSFITSTDRGETWGEPTHFIKDEVPGRHRPYARYAGNHVDTIAVCFTDAHPHDFGNSIYYAEFRGGKFYRADGALIKDLRRDGPLLPSEAEVVFRGSGVPGRDRLRSAERSAWTSSIASDANGRFHIGYTVYRSNADHRYRIASWNGKTWVDREVAYGGRCLYESQSSYTGLVTLDPSDPTQVAISTDVDPATGADLGGRHEIYRAKASLNDDISTIAWKPLTRNSPVRNLRPVIATGDGYRVILWLRGDYAAYTNYQLDVVGQVEE